MEAEHGFQPEQNLPIETKDVENRLQILDKELGKVLNKIRDWVKGYNQRARRVVFEPVEKRSKNISGLKSKIIVNYVNWGNVNEQIKYILGLIEQASDIKEQRRSIRYNLSAAREARRLAREGDLMASKGWEKVYRDGIEKPALSARTKRRNNLSELEGSVGDDEEVDESGKS
jgi:hypothetical protein